MTRFKRKNKGLLDFLKTQNASDLSNSVISFINISIILSILWNTAYFFNIGFIPQLSTDAVVKTLLVAIVIGLFVFILITVLYLIPLVMFSQSVRKKEKINWVELICLILIPYAISILYLHNAINTTILCLVVSIVICLLGFLIWQTIHNKNFERNILFVLFDSYANLPWVLFIATGQNSEKSIVLSIFIFFIVKIMTYAAAIIAILRSEQNKQRVILYIVLCFLYTITTLMPALSKDYAFHRILLTAPYTFTRTGAYITKLPVTDKIYKIYQDICNDHSPVARYNEDEQEKRIYHELTVNVLLSIGDEYIIKIQRNQKESSVLKIENTDIANPLYWGYGLPRSNQVQSEEVEASCNKVK